jgi:potassium-transporting ATPase KdpC subunit
MRRDLRTGAVSLLILTVVLGLGYSLAMTGISQAIFGDQADGGLVTRDGQVVGSKLLGQDFSKDPSYFQSRPSVTGYSGDVTYFNNLGPNSRKLARQLTGRVDDYLKLEGPYTPGLTRGDVPPDAVMSSASGVDPQISLANAEIQANRVAAERKLPLAQVQALIDDHTTGRGLGFLGEPGVNVLELNLALDAEDSK